MKCEFHKEEMERNPYVHEYVDSMIYFRIPFTNIRFMLYKDEPDYICLECLKEKEDYKEQRMFDAACEVVSERMSERLS